MIITEEDYLMHYGILRRSGRYPWGSGGTQAARNRSFLDTIEQLRKSGMSETDIAKSFSTPDQPFTTTQLRAVKSIAKNAQIQADIDQAQRLKDKGYSNVAIGKKMQRNESSVRDLLAPGKKDKADNLTAIADMLKQQVAEKKYIDVGVGVERQPVLGVSRTKLDTALAVLKEEGYEVHTVQIDQLGSNNQKTLTKVLAPPGTTYRDIASNKDQIKFVTDYSDDGGRTFFGIQTPLGIKSSRVHIRYAEDGGSEADGVIYVRPGVSDISLGAARYAQVRIMVDGSHYIKGMAMYKDDLPPGTDLVFNTNKHNTGHKLDALKPLKKGPDGEVDKDNPFGAMISNQIGKVGADGKKKLTSVMNIVNEEGDWERWSKTLSSQFLSKQSPKLAKTQLDMTAERKQRELDEIMSLTNPAVRAKLLQEFADDADSAAVRLKAAALPRQGNHVILPMNSMKENEIYAPNYNNGDRVVLVRHPHGGIFELPELTVNNRNPTAKKLLGDAKDAVGINSKVAARLSGADFDGDTVLVIPNNHGQIKTKPALAGLKGFDPVASYPGYPGMAKMTARTKAFQMGDVSNLITDMTIRGANDAELARAVRHSMVVIDAEKHDLNYKQSAIDNGIAQLKIKYQGSAKAGAKTLISRAKSRLDVPKRKPRPASQGGAIDRATGKRVFGPAETFVNSTGKTITKMERSTKLAETDNAHTLSSGTPIEKIYADHSNKLKELANKARYELVRTQPAKANASAKTAYKKEVTSLDAKLNIALRNAPLERNAQVLANSVFAIKKAQYPDADPSELKRMKAQALNEARIRTGAKKTRIDITDDEWAAIQAGAVSNHKLTQILANADTERVKQLATPKATLLMTSAKKQRAQAMVAAGFTQAEIAAQLGVSLTTLKVSLSGKD